MLEPSSYMLTFIIQGEKSQAIFAALELNTCFEKLKKIFFTRILKPHRKQIQIVPIYIPKMIDQLVTMNPRSAFSNTELATSATIPVTRVNFTFVFLL